MKDGTFLKKMLRKKGLVSCQNFKVYKESTFGKKEVNLYVFLLDVTSNDD